MYRLPYILSYHYPLVTLILYLILVTLGLYNTYPISYPCTPYLIPLVIVTSSYLDIHFSTSYHILYPLVISYPYLILNLYLPVTYYLLLVILVIGLLITLLLVTSYL